MFTANNDRVIRYSLCCGDIFGLQFGVRNMRTTRELDRVMPILQRALSSAESKATGGEATKVLKFDAQGNQIQ